MNDIIWETPPSISKDSLGSNGKHYEFSEALRGNPGHWAIFPAGKYASMVSPIKNGTLKDFRPAGAFEATARNVNQATQEATIYVRYVGDSEEF